MKTKVKNNHVSKLLIDLKAVTHNFNYFKSKLHKNTKIIVVIKAFGYGSDAVEIAKHLQNKVSYFAVAYTIEGIKLRNAGIKTPILVLHPQIENFEQLVKYTLEPTIYNNRVLKAFLSLTEKLNLVNYPIHIIFNTGLNRLGFQLNDIEYIVSKTTKNNTIEVASIFSHLSASEDKNERQFTLNQITTFKNIGQQFQKLSNFKPLLHLCNTSGIVNYPFAHFDMVRLGIGLYGFGNDPEITSKLKNVLSLATIISQIHSIKKGESIGYNRTYIAKKDMKIAILPIGYADGISRLLSNGVGYMLIKKQKAFVVGNISMDMTMIDISNINCVEGDEVNVFNTQKMIVNLAEITKTIPYEIITSISQRIKREILY